MAKLAEIGERETEANLPNKISRGGLLGGVLRPMPGRDWRSYGAAARGGLIALAILGSGAADKQDQRNTHAGHRHGRAENAATAPSSAARNSSPGQSALPAPASEQPETDWWGLSPMRLVARSTVILTGATILLGIGTVFLAFYTRRLVIHGSRNLHAALASARIAHRALAQAREAALETQRSARRIDRAYAFGGPGGIRFSEDKSQMIIPLEIHNGGKTPARVDRVRHALFISNNFPKDPPLEKCAIFDTDLIFGGNQGGGVFEEIIPIPKKPIHLFGDIRYKDIFGDEHESRFCLTIDPAGPLVTTSGPKAWNTWD